MSNTKKDHIVRVIRNFDYNERYELGESLFDRAMEASSHLTKEELTQLLTELVAEPELIFGFKKM